MPQKKKTLSDTYKKTKAKKVNILLIVYMIWIFCNTYKIKCEQGRIQDFFKRGGAKIKDWQNFGSCRDKGCLRGMCPLRRGEKL